MVLPAQSGPVYPPQYLPNVVESKCKVGHVVTYVRPPNREDGTPSSAEWAPTKVRLDSPRFGTALSDVGLEVGALLGQPERGPFGYLEKVDMTLPLPDRKAILRKRTAAWEELRSSNLQLVVGLRAKAVRKEEEAKLAALKKGSFGDDEPSIAQKLEAQRSAMIQASEEAIKASTVAAEKRFADRQKVVQDGLVLAKATASRQLEIVASAEAEQVEHAKKVTARNKKVQHEAVERDREKVARAERQQADAVQKLVRFVERDEMLEAARLRREAKMKRRRLAFAAKHAKKLDRITRENKEKEEAKILQGERTAALLAEAKVIRVQRTEVRQAAVAEENAERTKVAAERLLKTKKAFEEKEAVRRRDAAKKAVEVEVRMATFEEATARKIEEQRAAEAEALEERKIILEKRRIAREMADAGLKNAAEAKMEEVQAATQRRLRLQAMKSEESRLKFAAKRAQVERLKRVSVAEAKRREELTEVKKVRCDQTIRQQQVYIGKRRQMAIDNQVNQRRMLQAVKDRPLSAAGLSSCSDPMLAKVESLVSYERQQQKAGSVPLGGGKENRRAASASSVRRMVVSAPSIANRWTGEVEQSVQLDGKAASNLGQRPKSRAGLTRAELSGELSMQAKDSFYDVKQQLVPRDPRSGKAQAASLSESITLLRARRGVGDGFHVGAEDLTIDRRPAHAHALSTSGIMTPRTGQLLYGTDGYQPDKAKIRADVKGYLESTDAIRNFRAAKAAREELKAKARSSFEENEARLRRRWPCNKPYDRRADHATVKSEISPKVAM